MKYLFLAVMLVSCGKNEPVRQLADGAELLAQETGKFAESVGQIPRKIARIALGTDPEIEELSDDIKYLKARVNNKYDELKKKYEEADKDVKDALEKEIEDLEERIEEIEDEDYVTETELDDVEDDIEDLEDKLECASKAKGLKKVKECLE